VAQLCAPVIEISLSVVITTQQVETWQAANAVRVNSVLPNNCAVITVQGCSGYAKVGRVRISQVIYSKLPV
jgi:hypothetical protein